MRGKSLQWGSNPRPYAYEAHALPLSYRGTTSDTTKTLNIVLGDDENEESSEETFQAKLIADVRRSYETYAKPLREHKVKEFERFKKRFALSSYGDKIAEVLDVEPEVSRFYAELVPLQISPEEFWARLFFRLHLVTRHGNPNFEEEEEDEEELVWEEEEEEVNDKVMNQNEGNGLTTSDAVVEQVNTVTPPVAATTAAAAAAASVTVPSVHDVERDRYILRLEEENRQLKEELAILRQRVTDLEQTLTQQPTLSSSPWRTSPQDSLTCQEEPTAKGDHVSISSEGSSNASMVFVPLPAEQLAASQQLAKAAQYVDTEQLTALGSPEARLSTPRRQTSQEKPQETSSGAASLSSSSCMDSPSPLKIGSPHGTRRLNDEGRGDGSGLKKSLGQSSPVRPQPLSSSISERTSKYLAALDDEEDEEDGGAAASAASAACLI
eukprot:scaffold386_cov174-Ochromonas_danica.AAC.12